VISAVLAGLLLFGSLIKGVAVTFVILSLVGTVIALSRAFPYVPNGREGRWTAIAA
jgi:hypothetical protein